MAQAKKDKNAPKKGMSAYMIWMNTEGRSKVKADKPDASLGEIGKACGEMWREMNPAAKAKWEDKAKEDKARYEKEMAAYNKGGSGGAKADPEESGDGLDNSDDDSDEE